MATFLRKLKNLDGNTIAPATVAKGVFIKGSETLDDLLTGGYVLSGSVSDMPENYKGKNISGYRVIVQTGFSVNVGGGVTGEDDYWMPLDYWMCDIANPAIDNVNGIMNELRGRSTTHTIADYIYPVGSLYMTINPDFSPSSEWGGSWELLDSGLLLKTTSGNPGNISGSNTVDITQRNLPTQLQQLQIGDLQHDQYSYVVASGQGNLSMRTTEIRIPGQISGGIQTYYVYTGSQASNIQMATSNRINPQDLPMATLVNSMGGQPIGINPKSITVYVWKRIS